MRKATALSRCEVAGNVYNPGDSMLLTDYQLDSLVALGAAREDIAIAAMPSKPVGPENDTIAALDAINFRKLGGKSGTGKSN